MREIYAASNGMVVYSYTVDDADRLGAVKDNGDTYEDGRDMAGGGSLAFGPGRTIFSIPHASDQSIWALTDYGEVGDPEGRGMDYADNNPPLSPSDPSPTDGATDQSPDSIELSWTASDPDAGQNLKYDVFVCAMVEGEEAAFVPVANGLTDNSYTLTGLLEGTQYLWTVIATDGQAISEGPTWSFEVLSEPGIYNIYGKVSGSCGGPALEDIYMVLYRNSCGGSDYLEYAQTAADGSYSFTGLSNGNYKVKPLKTGYSFSPPEIILDIFDADVTGVNFTSY